VHLLHSAYLAVAERSELYRSSLAHLCHFATRYHRFCRQRHSRLSILPRAELANAAFFRIGGDFSNEQSIFYSQRYYFTGPTGTIYDMTSVSAYLTSCSVVETSLIRVKRRINCQGISICVSAYQYSIHLTKLSCVGFCSSFAFG